MPGRGWPPSSPTSSGPRCATSCCQRRRPGRADGRGRRACGPDRLRAVRAEHPGRPAGGRAAARRWSEPRRRVGRPTRAGWPPGSPRPPAAPGSITSGRPRSRGCRPRTSSTCSSPCPTWSGPTSWRRRCGAAGFPRPTGIRPGHPAPRRTPTRPAGSSDCTPTPIPGRSLNLHVRVRDWPNWRWALLFRDWLIADPVVAAEYLRAEAVAGRGASRPTARCDAVRRGQGTLDRAGLPTRAGLGGAPRVVAGLLR